MQVTDRLSGRASAYTKFDAKCAYMLGVFLFEVGSAICGAANLMDVLILGRALAGLGGVGMYVGVLTLLSAVTTPGERPVYLASVGITWGLGSVLGYASISPSDLWGILC